MVLTLVVMQVFHQCPERPYFSEKRKRGNKCPRCGGVVK